MPIYAHLSSRLLAQLYTVASRLCFHELVATPLAVFDLSISIVSPPTLRTLPAPPSPVAVFASHPYPPLFI